ncbi:hypothetical protein Q5P01_004236 [Channa striata]|uniref:Uncharacterized protein n=1 Tax=Channa striata TaxID=64152 RepID=A0AA88NL56_CHASR|nr:hypothetical protein Q5P01_004236 [Channa striata]
MGNICCPAESPCGSAEERSGLLNNESKSMVPSGETVVADTCGFANDNMRNKLDETSINVKGKDESVEVKQSPENGETKPNNTQENGPLQTESIQVVSPNRGSELEESSTRACSEDPKEFSHESGDAPHLQCTFDSQQKAYLEVFKATAEVQEEENTGSVPDKIPDGLLLKARASCTENPANPETTTAREHITESTTHDNDEDQGSKDINDNAADEPSGEYVQEVSALPNSQIAEAACQVSSGSVVSPESSREGPNPAVTEDSNSGSSAVCERDDLEDRSHLCSESSLGSEPAGLSHSGEKRDSVNSVTEPETKALADTTESLKSTQDAKPDLECGAIFSKATCLENIKEEVGKTDGDCSEAKEDNGIKEDKTEDTLLEAETETEKVDEIPGLRGKNELLVESTEVVTVTGKENSDEDNPGDSEEDLYRGAEELPASLNDKPQSPLVFEVLQVEDRCSLAPAVDILSYSEREWKGNTAKSSLIRKGYSELSQRFSRLRRVRGDNYCALRATLFQVLSHSTQLPGWLQEDDVAMLPKQLEAQQEGLISQWTFPGECLQGDGTGDATQQLKGYMELLQKRWQAAVDCPSTVERQQLCEQVFQGGEEELGLLEALKLLMLGRAVKLHGLMQCGEEVPLFCLLLFARDSSDSPRSFLSNHLSHVGLSAGLEQVEMFLLGDALECTIQVYRLYKADTEEFVTYYPDDHKDEWPCVCLVTEDDRHYNVPVVEAGEQHKKLSTS